MLFPEGRVSELLLFPESDLVERDGVKFRLKGDTQDLGYAGLLTGHLLPIQIVNVLSPRVDNRDGVITPGLCRDFNFMCPGLEIAALLEGDVFPK
jgi:hypothetical protein